MKWDESIFLREKHLKECLDTENGLKLRELRNEMIKLKELHNKEKESIDLISQKTLESLKSSFEQERKLLLGKMDAMKEEIGILNRNNSKNNSIYEELKGKMNEEVLGIKQNKEDLILKLENSMNTIQNLRFQIKENEQCYENRVKNYKEEKVLLQEEVKRLKQLIVENQYF